MRVEHAGRERLRFIVEDNGPGIAPAERARVFERFHRTDPARDRASGGTGLGLAIVRAIVEAHRGRVWASQSPEGGARIEIELGGFTPKARPAAERRGPGLAAAGAPSEGQRP
jgi:signal transduction histidine kinase